MRMWHVPHFMHPNIANNSGVMQTQISMTHCANFASIALLCIPISIFVYIMANIWYCATPGLLILYLVEVSFSRPLYKPKTKYG